VPQLDYSASGVHTITVRAVDRARNWTELGPFNLLVKPAYNLSLSKSVTPTMDVAASDLLTYTPVVVNRTTLGNHLVTNLRLTDTLPADVTLISALPECSRMSDVVCLWSAPSIGENESLTVTLAAQIAPGWSGRALLNRAEVSADGRDTEQRRNVSL